MVPVKRLVTSGIVSHMKIASAPSIDAGAAGGDHHRWENGLGASERFTMLEQVSVPSVTLESQIGSHSWFGKFDVQGMELEIIEGAGSSL